MAADPIVAPPRPRAPQRPRLRPAPPPRRVSGTGAAVTAPARAGRRRAPRAGAVALPAPTPLRRALDLLRGLPDSKLLDRLLRGQGWVVLIGVALMGIVALQVSLLKMNAGIGQSIERSAQLERQNADLRAEVSKLSSEERIASVAGRLGLVMPDANLFRYVRVRGEVDARKAASVMRAPDPVEQTATAPSATAATPAATTTAAPTTTTAPASGPTATAPTATTTPPAQTAPTAPQTPTQATPTGTTSGATAAPAGTPTAPGQ